ncbi:hypothetical protein [Stigmatella erecta]|uniref:Outer membrane protein beta-barrel domain-containing protein n=1 Tax=Stigmatella erecta TaxID=83460 RepID=A0A1I0JHI4_9BACT|nr:hypothetical protein [Stigmatella erecta]SEU09717.1 hypothetical protein SAMN05443639_107286 [Stigmatella erecta]
MRSSWLLLSALMAPALAAAEGLGAHFALSAGAGRGLSGPSIPASDTGLALLGGAYLELGGAFSLGIEAATYAHLSDLQSLRILLTEEGPLPLRRRETFGAWRLAPALEWRPDTGALRPRVSASLGFYRLSSHAISESPFSRLNSDFTDAKGTLGAGLSLSLDYFIHQKLGVGVTLHYDSAYNNFDQGLTSWASVAAGVRF